MATKLPITTHVLNLEEGKPAEGIKASILKQQDSQWILLDRSITNDDGRVADWLADYKMEAGVYRLIFETGVYFEAKGLTTLYPSVTIDFVINDLDAHYHIPLLLTRHGFSTYRGS